jgi:hypothetical protein
VNFFSRRCFFRAIRLWRISGPQASFPAKKKIAKVKGAKLKEGLTNFLFSATKKIVLRAY